MPKKKTKKPAKKPAPHKAKPEKALTDQELSEEELDNASGGTLSPWAVNLSSTTFTTSDVWSVSSLSTDLSWKQKR